MACNPNCDPVSAVVSGVTDSVVQGFADSVMVGVDRLVTSLGTAWVHMPWPSLLNPDGSPTSAVSYMQGSMRWLTLVLFTVSLMFAGMKLMWDARRGAQLSRAAFADVLVFVLISAGGLAVLDLVMTIIDAMSVSVLEAGNSGGFLTVKLAPLLAGFAGVPALQIVLGVVSMIVLVAQMGLLVVRAAIMPLMAGLWPAAAAVRSTETGRVWFQRLTSWLLAFAVYKLVAALIYGLAFRMASDPGTGVVDGLLKGVMGLVLLVLAIVALPALMRLMAPMTAAVAGGGGGAGAVAGVAALAGGAVNLGMQMGSSHSHGGGGGPSGGAQSQPSTAQGATETGAATSATGSAVTGAGAGAGSAVGAGAGAAGPWGAVAGAGLEAVSGVARGVADGARGAVGGEDEQEAGAK